MRQSELQYAVETQQSICDRLTDELARRSNEIDTLHGKLQDKEATIAALGATNKKLKIEIEKYQQIAKATYEKDMLTALGERDN